MKIKKVFFYILTFSPIIISLFALPFLPNKIPSHYGFEGDVARWGSKYESLILPLLTLLFSFIMGSLMNNSKQNNYSRRNIETLLITSNSCLVLFDFLCFFFLYLNLRQIDDIGKGSVDFNKFIFLSIGVVMIISGLIMPKTKMNSYIGLRTPWSTKNEKVWLRSQKFGGFIAIVSGILIIVASFLNSTTNTYIWIIIIFVISLIIDVYFTYKISKIE